MRGREKEQYLTLLGCQTMPIHIGIYSIVKNSHTFTERKISITKFIDT